MTQNKTKNLDFNKLNDIDLNKIKYFQIDMAINDTREIRGLILPNNIKLVLVSDPQSSSSSCAVGINAGFNQDEFEGSAHFLEHLLFMGSKKYPEHSEYHSFIQTHGGNDNAYTSSDITNYYIEIPSKFLEKGIDMLSWFFRDPLLQEKYIKSEMEIIDSEHNKNILSDMWRVHDIFKKFLKENQKFKKFGTGCIESLKDIQKEDILKFYNNYYTTDNMYICIVDTIDIKMMLKYVKYFYEIPEKSSDVKNIKENLKLNENNVIIYNSISDYNFLNINIIFKADETKQDEFQLSNLLSYLIGSEFISSLCYILKENRIIDEMSSSVDFFDLDAKIIITFFLLNDSINNINKIYQLFNRYLESLKKISYKQFEEIYNNFRKIKLLKALYNEKKSASELSQDIVENLIKGNNRYVIQRKYITPECSKDLYNKFIRILKKNNINIITNLNFLKVDKKDFVVSKYYDSEYFITKHIFDIENKPLNIKFDNLILIKDLSIDIDVFEKDYNKNKFPKLIINDIKNSREVYYLDINKYKVPMSYISIMRKNVKLFNKNLSLIGNIYCLIIEKILNYYLDIMKNYKMYFDISVNNDYLIINILGIDSILQKFVIEIIKNIDINNFFLNKKNKKYFAEVKEELIIDLENNKFNPPYILVCEYLKKKLDNTIMDNEALEFLKILNWDMFKKECQELLKYSKEIFLFIGNFNTNEGTNINQFLDILSLEKSMYFDKKLEDVKIINNFKIKDYTLTKNEINKYEINNCLSKNYIMYNYDITLSNDVINIKDLIKIIYKQIIYEIIAELLNEPLFTKIRTNDKLGYIVRCKLLPKYYNNQIKYILQYIIQSNQPIEKIIFSINEFNENYKVYIIEKKKELEEKFNHLKEGKITLFEKNFTTLKQEASSYVKSLIIYKTNIFNRKKIYCEIIKNLKFNDIYKNLYTFFYKNNKLSQFSVIINKNELLSPELSPSPELLSPSPELLSPSPELLSPELLSSYKMVTTPD
jgi:insulysin